MVKIKETIVVEGIYDKKTLSQFLDANIIRTDGFRIYKDKQMVSLLKKMADTTGVIILTDSDSAGFRIRNFIKNQLQGKNVKHAYIPDIKGKEKRKHEFSKEGMLGVEGIEKNIILLALQRAGATMDDSAEKEETPSSFTKADLFRAGLYGQDNSRQKRDIFLEKLGLPKHISVAMLLDVLNTLYRKEEEPFLFE